MAAHQDVTQWLLDGWDWLWVLILLGVLGEVLDLVFGVVGTVIALAGAFFSLLGTSLARVGRSAVGMGEVRHRRRVELELARRGVPYVQAGGSITGVVSTGDRAVNVQATDIALPAAVIPSPPSARRQGGKPEECQHETIVPVIGTDGEHKRWVCANWPRCDAQFPKSIAIYEP